jgi:hypothetical protein
MHFNRKKMDKAKIKILPVANRSKRKTGVSKKDIAPVISFSKLERKGRRMLSISKDSSDNKNNSISDNIVDKWANSLTGHPAFILGNAPSISDVNLQPLEQYFTIGINRIFYIYDPTILMWQDRQIIMQERKNVLKQRAIKFCSSQSDAHHLFYNFKVFNNPCQFSMIPSVLYGRGNTGVLAVEFAVALGCSSVVLLGMDCKYGEKGKTDFYGKNRDHKPYTLKMCRSSMKFLKDSCPVPVYNCGDIDFWPKQSLEEVISILNPQKLGRENFKRLLFQ